MYYKMSLPFQDGDSVLIRNTKGELIEEHELGVRKAKKICDECIFKLVSKGKTEWAILNSSGKYLSISEEGTVAFSSPIPITTETFVFKGITPISVQILYKNPNVEGEEYYYLSLNDSFELSPIKEKDNPTTKFNFEVL